MKVAICGYPPLALQLQEGLKDSDIEFQFFIEDLVSSHGKENLSTNLTLINFFEFKWLVSRGELDGVIIAEDERSNFAKSVVKTLKFHNISQVGVLNLANLFNPIYWLDSYKIFMPYLEADITDVCNLKCAGCYHFANFSLTEDLYPLETFRRDVRQVTRDCDILTFRLLGGEPFILKNFDEYIKVTRQYFPKSNLGIVTNGLLIPSTSQKVLDSIRENKFSISISVYPPTKKILDKISTVLDENKIPYTFDPVEKFLARMTLNGKHNPLRTRSICSSDVCRSMFNGKIYKCPIDVFSFKFAKKFSLKKFPKATGVDIFAPNFPSLVQILDDNIELCNWCGEQHRQIPWEPTNNPQLEDWLVDPEEINSF